MKVSKTAIDQILQHADIVDIVSESVQLKKEGTRYRGLCPFHDEKTPSFVVYPSTNTCKCYGCGRRHTVISYVMEKERLNFPEAVRFLAKRYGVVVDEKEESPEESQNRLKKEVLMGCLQSVAEFYRKQFLQSKDAQNYAYGRWGKEYCDSINIGYAPGGGHELRQLNLNEDILKELGLINKGGYDMFQNRITVNICNRYGMVIGFTARTMGDEKPKYLNSTDSLVYHKRESLFGIETAWNPIVKMSKAYLVEGGPDCMRLHSIEVYNTVACLGSEWTDEQFKTLKRVAWSLCFIPDIDPPKDGNDFGHGVENVFKAGGKAIQMGFSVTVKEIPDKGENKKQDPDSYFTNKDIFDGVLEEDFILWYAGKLFGHADTMEQLSDVIKRISSLLAEINDETKQTMYVEQLLKYYKKRKIWQTAIETERKRKKEETSGQGDKKEKDIFREHGFYIKGNRYISLTDKGSEFLWSNFILEPLYHIEDTIMPKRLFQIRNVYGIEKLIEFKQDEMISLPKFKLKTEGLGNFIWNAGDKELNKLKNYLYELTDSARSVTQMGWQRQGFYAFGNGVFFQDEWHEADNYGIVKLQGKGNIYIPASSDIYRDDPRLYDYEKRFVHLKHSKVTLREFAEQFFLVFGDNGKIGFAFLLATLFRDIVTASTSQGFFPLLSLFGPKGSGKTDMGKTLMRFFVTSDKTPNVRNSTVPALNDTVAAVSNGLVLLDEYKNDLDPVKVEFLKGLWDGSGRQRMNMELDKRKEVTAVDSGIIIAGQEMPTTDIALFTRLIFLRFPRSVFSNIETERFERLKEMREDGFTHLTLEILRHRDQMKSEFRHMLRNTMKDLSKRSGTSDDVTRIANNWAVPLAAYRCLEIDLDLPHPYQELLEIAQKGIAMQNTECKTNNELGGFWNTVQFLVSQGDLLNEGDYMLKYHDCFKSDVVKPITWQNKRPVLYLQKSRVFKLYRQSGKTIGDKVLPEESLKYYLINSKAYLGEKQCRFKVFFKGMPQYELSPIPGRLPTQVSKVFRAFCFDYLKLVDEFDINFESAASSSQAEDIEE